MEILSSRLKELREQKKLSMEKLSQFLSISNAAICKWENNQTEPRASNIKILCDYFEVSSDYLLGLENEIGTKKYYTPTQKETNKKNPLDELSPDEQKIITQYRDLKLGYKNLAQKQIQTIWDYQQNEMTQIDSHKKKTPKTS